MMKRTIRQLQFNGGVCVALFCKHFGIKHPFIDKFIVHQLNLLCAKNLPEWEGRGCRLNLSGLGDPLPKEIVTLLNGRNREPFKLLIEVSAEIGLIDMYGRESDQPSRFFKRCCDILTEQEIHLPFGSEDKRIEILTWGEPLNQIEFQQALAGYAEILPTRSS